MRLTDIPHLRSSESMSETAKSEAAARTEAAKTEAAKSEAARTEAARTEAARTEAAKSADERDDAPRATRSTPAKADPSRYATSSDPAVHKLLADRQGHVSNLETLQPTADPAAVKAAQDAIAAIDKQLEEL
jgi:hypothetical protein